MLRKNFWGFSFFSVSLIPDTSLVVRFICACVNCALMLVCGTVILGPDISFHCMGGDGLEDKAGLTGLKLTIHPISD